MPKNLNVWPLQTTEQACPHCDRPDKLPAAVYPGWRRHCPGCGHYFTIVKSIIPTIHPDEEIKS